MAIFRAFAVTLILSAAVTSCLSPETGGQRTTTVDEAAATPTPTPSATVTATPNNSVDAALYLQIQYAWETSSTYTTLDTCQLALGSGTPSTPTSPAVPATTTCAMELPEGQLHFSKLRFIVGTAETSSCKTVLFYPYYYQGSDQADVTMLWDETDTEIDCDTVPIIADCFNGVGRHIIPGFPSNRAIYFLSEDGNESTFNVASSSQLDIRGNTLTCNNLDPAERARAAGDYTAAGYTYMGGGRYQDYVVECRDEFHEIVYQATVTLSDVDPGAPNGSDHFPDWAPWDI